MDRPAQRLCSLLLSLLPPQKKRVPNNRNEEENKNLLGLTEYNQANRPVIQPVTKWPYAEIREIESTQHRGAVQTVVMDQTRVENIEISTAGEQDNNTQSEKSSLYHTLREYTERHESDQV